jgi:hypothetical protein
MARFRIPLDMISSFECVFLSHDYQLGSPSLRQTATASATVL